MSHYRRDVDAARARFEAATADSQRAEAQLRV
jgi:hypothetical protein